MRHSERLQIGDDVEIRYCYPETGDSESYFGTVVGLSPLQVEFEEEVSIINTNHWGLISVIREKESE